VSLVADQNELTSIDSLPELPLLETLSLNKNDITDLDRFIAAAIKRFPTLAHVSLLGNPCCPSELSGGTPEQ
jgi:Leucine-rich repeat (LRR) protein